MMMVPAYVSCSESSGFVTSLYALTQFNTNELTLTLLTLMLEQFLRRERDTLTIKPTAIKYRYQKQQLSARK